MLSRHLTLLVGLPATGKTTFLAALYHVSEEGDVPGAMRIELLSGDRTYLNEIRDRWLRCEEAQHTAAGKEEEVSLLFSHGSEVEVVVPDLSGESFVSLWEHRAWPASFDALVREAFGVLLFLHPNELQERQTIESANRVLEAVLEGIREGSAGSDVRRDPEPEPEWNPATTPDQVKVVDVLQCIARRAGEPPPVAVVISAWDTQPEDAEPMEWLARRVPLLDQYLQAHASIAPFRVYGVSAQGGEIERDRNRLLGLVPSQRIRVVGEEVTSEHDVTAPLHWLLTVGGGERQ